MQGALKILLPMLFLAGCLSIAPEPIEPLANARQFEQRSLNDPDLQQILKQTLPERQVTEEGWGIDPLTVAALYFHPDMQVASAQLAVARAAVETADESPNPTVALFPQFISNPGSLPSWAYTFNLSVPIETAGKREKRVAHAEATVEAARYQVELTGWQVRMRVREALLALFKAECLGQILEREHAVLRENDLLIAARAANGSVAEIAALESRSVLTRHDQLRSDVERQKLEGRILLSQAIGIPSKALEHVLLDFSVFNQVPVFSPDFLKIARENALKGRYVLLQSLANYAASEATLQLELAKQYPDLALGPNYIWNQGVNKWGIGVNGPLPVINQNQGPIHEAQARREEAAQRFNALQDQVIGEIDQRVVSYSASLNSLKSAEIALASQRALEKKVRDISRPGDISRPQLLRSRVGVLSAEVLRLDSLVAAQTALGNLEMALQVPLASSASRPGEMTEPNSIILPVKGGRHA